eukprot:TRINITY_DN53572_c0_g1_i1.p1 TRINITY_DN53572_c0_g1~~TRINITY_DN53572_c0_g1_i1.p1  ORF type:complete len:458 (+),score=98.56 TRINITY_DN53572_c0_g1_i1:52-1374(+)
MVVQVGRCIFLGLLLGFSSAESFSEQCPDTINLLQGRASVKKLAADYSLSLKQLEDEWHAGRAQSAASELADPMCELGPGENCSISQMTGPTNVKLPISQDTKCFYGDDYNFGVLPGDSDKLLLYFNAGGACWKGNTSATVMQCNSGIDVTAGNSGMLSSADANPFKHFTMVRLKYCSGDLFIGNSTDYWDRPVQQKGYNIVRKTLDWVKANFPGKLQTLLISGSSAGCMGAQFWTSTILKEMSFEEAFTIYDSYAGVFPAGTESQVLRYWKACRLPVLSVAQQAACESGDLNAFHASTSTEEAISAHPEVAFSSMDSKWDEIQQSFYQAMAMSYGVSPSLNKGDFYFLANRIREKYINHGNFAPILIDGYQHTFTTVDSTWFHTALKGENGRPGQSIIDFVQKLLKKEATPACSGNWQINSNSEESFCDVALMAPTVKV